MPQPFIWGFYDGKEFRSFTNTEEFVNFIKFQRIILYMHNGGKFDFMFLLPYIKETKVQVIGAGIVSMFIGVCELRDSFRAVPEALGKIQKKSIEMWKLEADVRHNHMDEIIEYNKWDCIYLYDLMKKYREIVGSHKTIASNALAFSRKLGVDPGKTNARFDDKYRKFYYGGRTEVFNPGRHTNLKIIDIRSAYPYAMLHDHPTSAEWIRLDNIDGLSRDQVNRCMIELECYSKGALPERIIGPNGGLSFPHKHGTFYITGWEYNTAMDFGLLSDVEFISVRHTENTINFKPYVDHWFSYKAAHDKRTNPIEYTIGKIMMNSLSGKLSQDARRYYDYRIVSGGTKICYETNFDAKGICQNCGAKGQDHGWVMFTEYEGHEIHRRESLWKYKFEDGVNWQGRNIFYNVATAASVTGFTRAHLLRAAHTVGIDNAIYSDTDSLILQGTADLSLLPTSKQIGDWEIEDEGCPIGYFAGKKLYGIRHSPAWEADNPGKSPFKIACKGSKLEFDQIERICNGETVIWKNQAPTFKIDGSANFVVRKIRQTAFRREPETVNPD